MHEARCFGDDLPGLRECRDQEPAARCAGSSVTVDLAGGSVEIAGAIEEAEARQAIERAGFRVTGRIA
jgi:hypothetical protein